MAHPQTLNEVLDCLDADLSAHQKEELRHLQEQELCRTHFALAAGIRTGYGLWDKASPLVAALGGPFPELGHPDDASAAIVKAYWQRLQEGPSPDPWSTAAS